MLECDLSQPVSDWMASIGYTPYAEVPFPMASANVIDLVGRKGSELITVELKRSLTKHLIRQAYMCDLITSERYAAIGTKPKTKGVQACERSGIGLLSFANGMIQVLAMPKERGGEHWVRDSYQAAMHKTLDRMQPNGVGGVPCLKGIGITQELQRRVDEYREAYPLAKWKEIFANVPNHYDNHRNMYSALRSNVKRLAWRAREAQRRDVIRFEHAIS